MLQCRRPLYFSEKPLDLPIGVPASHILTPEGLCEQIGTGAFVPSELYASQTSAAFDLELDLLAGHYRDDDDIPNQP